MPIDLYFCRWTRDRALEVTNLYAQDFAGRLMPAFDNIEAEADQAAEDRWQQAMAAPAWGGDFDPGDFADAATEHGIEVYENLHFARQQLIGLTAAGLYHLWEQLLKQFLRKELRRWSPDPIDFRKLASADLRWVEELLQEFGFSLRHQTYYGSLSELRLVANVVKHGDGKSCDDLKAMAPRLFLGSGLGLDILSPADDLVLEEQDFERYVQAVRNFWQSFPERLVAGVQ